MKNILLHLPLIAVLASALGLGACGGGANIEMLSMSGTITGLTVSGLTLSNGSSTVVPIANSNAFTFTSTIAKGSPYAVGILTQPKNLTCVLANASGITILSSITDIAVSCTPNRVLGGVVSGLTASGLVLANGSDTVTLAANATAFSFPAKVGNGSAYGVTVLMQPAGLTCSVINGAALMGTADVTSVLVNCLKQI